MNYQSQKGVAAIEMTLLLPFMLLLVFATTELGRLMFQYNTLTKLVRDAGIFLSHNADTRQTSRLPNPLIDAECNNCISKAKNLLVYGTINSGGIPLLSGLTTSNVSILESPVGSRRLIIDVSYDWQPLFGEGLTIFGLGNSVDLSFNLNTHYAVTAL
jgi:hypothetical protein